MRLPRPHSIALALALLAACPRRPASPTELLERAVAEASHPSAGSRALALAGFHAYLIGAEPALAAARFEQALAQDSSEPYALAGQLLLARRQEHPERELEAALALCERAPTHPLAAAGARRVQDLAGTSGSLDELILARVRAALGRGVPGETALLLRGALASVHAGRDQAPELTAALSEMGVPTTFTVLGPLSPFSFLTFDEATEPEQTGSLLGPFSGPFVAVTPRVLRFPDGRFSLEGEPPQGDVYLLAVDLEVPEEATYVVRTVSSAAHKGFLDGSLLFQRRSFARAQSLVSAAAVELTAGRHRLLLRLSRDQGSANLVAEVFRADGRPSRISFSAASGLAPSWSGVPRAELGSVYSDAQAFFAALEEEAGGALASYLAAFDGLERDRDGAKRLIEPLSRFFSSPAISSLRADLALEDPTLPTKVAHGRATRDLDAALERDRGEVHALLSTARLALEDGRHLEAAELVRRARAAHQPAGFPAVLMQARVELALGLEAQADATAAEAARLQPGLCEALSLRYELARRRDAVALADELLAALSLCPGSTARQAEHLKSRGELKAAAALYQTLLARAPAHLPTANSLLVLFFSLHRYQDARALLQALRSLWPRNAVLWKKAADVEELAGRPEEALAYREKALALDGGDLPLRRAVERARHGREPLQEYAIDGKAAIAAYEERPLSEGTGSAYVLDAAAVRAYPDGSTVDRIHIVQKALDQSGVSEVGEVTIPSGAYVLALRTIKADGTVLEPESIGGKDSISLPGVQVGDYVEYEYLQANPSRGPAQPGFTSSAFYFQVSNQPNHWSTYTVVAPRGMGLEVDAHNTGARRPEVRGEEEVFSHDERRVPPYIPEPDAPPSGNEYLPFVVAGAGQRGNEGLVMAYADGYLDRGQVSFELEELARAAAAGKEGREAVRAFYLAVMQKLTGRDAGLGTSAAASLAQGRGSRLWTLKAGLESLGIRARVAAVRPFRADPASYRFPTEALLPYLCLRVELPEETLWLDPLVRFAPFGELPEPAMGEREAYLFPEPGRPLEKVKTPAAPEPPGKEVALELALDAEGKLTGSGEETYFGFHAAQLAEALESVAPDQRDQALQSALARYFGGAELSNLKLEIRREVGAPLRVRYRFSAPRFARVEDEGKLVLGALTFPSQLGRRYVQLGSRRTPLYLDATEASRVRARLTLPAGYRVLSPEPELKTSGRFGRFLRREREEGGKLVIEEELRLGMARVPAAEYQDFARFAGEVDLIQARDLVIARSGGSER